MSTDVAARLAEVRDRLANTAARQLEVDSPLPTSRELDQRHADMQTVLECDAPALLAAVEAVLDLRPVTLPQLGETRQWRDGYANALADVRVVVLVALAAPRRRSTDV